MSIKEFWVTNRVSRGPGADDVGSRSIDVNDGAVVRVICSVVVNVSGTDSGDSRSTSRRVVASVVGVVSSCNSDMNSNIDQLCSDK